MIERLFRGKRTDNYEWVYGYYVPVCFGRFPCVPAIVPKQEGVWEPMRVIPETVGQDTGLTDKNGKKIFEGDYVITKFGRPCRVRRFVSACFCGIDFLPLNTKYRPPTEYDMYRSDNLEVIGNIHDNPGLLEVTT